MTATMPGPAPLDASRLRRACQLAALPFATTDELADLGELPGQGRAMEAIRFGVAMPHHGYNLFVLGPPGSGRDCLLVYVE
jgi:predicted ATPase with chaperone activity